MVNHAASADTWEQPIFVKIIDLPDNFEWRAELSSLTAFVARVLIFESQEKTQAKLSQQYYRYRQWGYSRNKINEFSDHGGKRYL